MRCSKENVFFFIDVFPNLAPFSATFVTIVTAAYFF